MGDRNGRSRRRGDGDGTLEMSALLDRFTDIDDQIEDTNDALRDLVQLNRTIAEILSSMSGDQPELPGRNDLPLIADEVIQPQIADGVTEPDDYDGNTAEVDLNVPRDGKLTRALLSFPAGANQALGIGVDGVDDENLVPYGPAGVNYVALNNDNVGFDLDYEVANDETLTVRFINTRIAEDQQQIDELTAYLSAILTVTEVV